MVRRDAPGIGHRSDSGAEAKHSRKRQQPRKPRTCARIERERVAAWASLARRERVYLVRRSIQEPVPPAKHNHNSYRHPALLPLPTCNPPSARPASDPHLAQRLPPATLPNAGTSLLARSEAPAPRPPPPGASRPLRTADASTRPSPRIDRDFTSRTPTQRPHQAARAALTPTMVSATRPIFFALLLLVIQSGFTGTAPRHPDPPRA